MPTLKSLRLRFHKYLDPIYEKDEIDSFFYLLIAYRLNLNKVDSILQKDLEIEDDHYDFFENALEQLKIERPIQYIIGETEFCGLLFKVNENVLIPRPETEELVDLIIKSNTSKKSYNILDVGTGSGCIAISLAKNFSNSAVYAVDVSSEALEVSKFNASWNKVEVSFVKMDVLQQKSSKDAFIGLKFDIIVSNPPYVRHLEKSEIKNNVLNFEPNLALFVDDNDPLVFYRAICEWAVDKLAPNGQLYFEINQYLGSEMVNLLKEFNFKEVCLIQDHFGNNRFVTGIFK